METSDVKLARVKRTDLDELLQANQESRDYHGRWVQPFTTTAGFEEWYSAQTTGASVGLVARDRESGQIVGVTNLSQIFYRGFQNAYLSYWGMVSFAGTGRMSQAVELTTRYAFEELGLHRLEANIQPEKCAFNRAGQTSRISERGILSEIPSDRRGLVRSRALGASGR
jgi:ribosomal-protein-alanine N-acetyltransferase